MKEKDKTINIKQALVVYAFCGWFAVILLGFMFGGMGVAWGSRDCHPKTRFDYIVFTKPLGCRMAVWMKEEV